MTAMFVVSDSSASSYSLLFLYFVIILLFILMHLNDEIQKFHAQLSTVQGSQYFV
jgi:hypothetical protein